jgi:hypothetical protein
MEMDYCLGSEGNGVSMGGGGEGGHGPPERGKYKQLMPSKDGDNMEKEEEEQSHQA